MVHCHTWLGAFLLVLAGLAFGQAKTTEAKKLPAGVNIVIDGVLNEPAWSAGEKKFIDPTLDPTNGIYGATPTSADDVSGWFVALWSDQGLYIGTHFKDDIHNAPNAQYPDAANNAYDDDGIQYVLNVDMQDALAGLNTFGKAWSPIRGFGNLNPAEQYCGWWAGEDGSGKGWSTAVLTPEQAKAEGWDEVFSTADGLNYDSEVLWSWSGKFMNQVGSRSVGDQVAYNMYLNDNDGTFSAESRLFWTPNGHGDGPKHWGAIALGNLAEVGISRNIRTVATPKSGSVNSTFDLLGRKITGSRQINGASKVLIMKDAQGRAVRSLVQ